jgi:hypothetical protein
VGETLEVLKKHGIKIADSASESGTPVSPDDLKRGNVLFEMVRETLNTEYQKNKRELIKVFGRKVSDHLGKVRGTDCRLPELMNFMKKLVDPAGKFRMTTTQLCKFVKNSVVAACDNDVFITFLDTLVDPAGKFKMTTAQLVTFVNIGVAVQN